MCAESFSLLHRHLRSPASAKQQQIIYFVWMPEEEESRNCTNQCHRRLLTELVVLVLKALYIIQLNSIVLTADMNIKMTLVQNVVQKQ